MRRSSRALLGAALAAAVAAAPARAKSRGYDPEIALLIRDDQTRSVDLVGEELLRQAGLLNLGAMRALLPYQLDHFKERVKAGLTLDSDVVEDYRREITDMSPGDAGEIDKLIAEIRRLHGLPPGPPLVRVPLPAAAGNAPILLEEAGVGPDVEPAIKGAPLMGEPAADDDRLFGSGGAFARRRKWNVDFNLGAFSDLAARYRKLGYRRAYRLRAPFAAIGRAAYVLSPAPGQRPRLLYCEFYGEDLFLHTRAHNGRN